jgi:hypothetical protein
MLGKITLAAGLVAAATAFGAISASAAPALPQSRPAPDSGLVLQAKHGHHHHHHRHHRFHRFGGAIVLGSIYGGYCVGWRHECAARWGWRTRGYYRCLWRHGC